MVLLAYKEAIYHEWRRLVLAHSVSGVQVHDARRAAAMSVHGVTHLLTLNPEDFKRYTPTSPLCILAAWLILANRAATRPPRSP
jgi:hypothetical protein